MHEVTLVGQRADTFQPSSYLCLIEQNADNGTDMCIIMKSELKALLRDPDGKQKGKETPELSGTPACCGFAPNISKIKDAT